MNKHRTGTPQEILDRHYAKCREQNAKKSPLRIDRRRLESTALAISRRMKAYWAQQRRKPKRFVPTRTPSELILLREQQKANIAQWQKEYND